MIDNILNKITMYRVVLYELIGLLIVAGALGALGILQYSPAGIFFSVVYILAICIAVNKIFAWAYGAPNNPESTYITALILALIITPASSFGDFNFLIMGFWASSLAMASKYILAIGKKHIFNPAAIAVVITAFALNQSASWWVGTISMFPFVIIGGILVARKIQRLDMAMSAVNTSLIIIIILSFLKGGNIFATGWTVLAYTPLIFFATIMLTEPLTTPGKGKWRFAYGMLAGILFIPNIHLGSIYSTPELALIAANIFSYIVSSKKKLVLTLENIKKISNDTYDFIFTPDRKLHFEPGQYMEWTLAHGGADSRGIRRYFTLASSPTEPELHLGVKFYEGGSSFKKKLLSMKEGERIVAGGLAGDFVLPKNKKRKLAFIAGGIGITPFRSQIRYLMDTKEARKITLLYSNRTAGDAAYKEIFDEAQRLLGIKTFYNTGVMEAKTIREQVPDYKERTFYISGPRGMVTSFEQILRSMEVKEKNIITDFFPGFA